jgi:hypothetical protein
LLAETVWARKKPLLQKTIAELGRASKGFLGVERSQHHSSTSPKRFLQWPVFL